MKVDRGVFCVIVVIWRREIEGNSVSGGKQMENNTTDSINRTLPQNRGAIITTVIC